MSEQRLKQGWSRKTDGERLNLWLPQGLHRLLKEMCDREGVTPSVAIEEALLERDLLRTRLGLVPALGVDK